ncbi:RNA-directed DNA polymerase, eukaryota [Tanacetum coccineum]
MRNEDRCPGKADARFGQWVEITMKKDYLKRYVCYSKPECEFKYVKYVDWIMLHASIGEHLEESEVRKIGQRLSYHCTHLNTGNVLGIGLGDQFGVRKSCLLCDMLNEIGQLNINVNEDTCTWSLGPNGTFTDKDARYRIDQNIFIFALCYTWDKSIPRKVNVFMWRLSLDQLPHILNLSLRGMDIPAISCPSCNANVESANHVFFECDIATDMWKLVFRWCDIPLFQASFWDSFND